MAKRAKSSASGAFDEMTKMAFEAAEATLKRLRREIAILEKTFPELSTPKGRAKLAADAEAATRKLSDASQKAVAARVKSYRAARKKG